MASSLLQGKFPERTIQTVCDCEQRRNTSTARNALGPFPDEPFLSGIDKILCFFGISDVYEILGYCPLAYDCNYFSSSSLSSLSEVNLDYAPHPCPRLLFPNLPSKQDNYRGGNVCTPEICEANNSSDADYISASSKIDCKCIEIVSNSCPPCKETICRKVPPVTSPKSGKILPENKSLQEVKSRKSLPKQDCIELISPLDTGAREVQKRVNIGPLVLPKCLPLSHADSDQSSGSFTFKVKCRPVQANMHQRKGKPVEKLPTIVSSSFYNQEVSNGKNKCNQVIVIKPPKKNCAKPNKGHIADKKKPKIIDTKWALARINVFDDCSRTYEIMELKKKIPRGIVPDKTVVFFAVLPDGTTCCYDCLGATRGY